VQTAICEADLESLGARPERARMDPMSTRSPLSSRFGSRVRELRELRKQRLEDIIAAGAGGSNGRLSRLERGRVSPTLRTVEELADVLQVEPLDLFVYSKESMRHHVVAATRTATKLQLEQVMRVLQRPYADVPSPDELRERIARLPPWARSAVRDLVEGLDGPRRHARGAFGSGLRDARPSELVLIDGVVIAFERFVEGRSDAAHPARVEPKPTPNARVKRRSARVAKKGGGP
jgi:transcriptional regulator with XRE-family HTH domain